MGKLIKNHWARLIMLTAATYQIGAAVEGYFWPKIFWDFLTHSLDAAVKPAPILQTINLVFGIAMLALEWPLPSSREPASTDPSSSASPCFPSLLSPACSLKARLSVQNPGLYLHEQAAQEAKSEGRDRKVEGAVDEFRM
ncbi:hypothetical protein TrVFT333_005585 [Trichoderma virens FT-333]|nr:hypothetical protein TrVFT333_005585 [Trichoderma virens FT-333]